MSHRLTKIWSKILAAGLLLILMVALLTVSIVPLRQAHLQLTENLRRQQATLAQQERLFRQSSVLERELEAIISKQSAVQPFLSGPSTDLAAAELQRYVKVSVQQAGGQLLSTRVQPAQHESEYQRISLDVKLRIHTPGLVKFLRTLEVGVPMLTVDRLHIRALIVRSGELPEVRPLDLDVKLSISGYLPAEEAIL